MCIYQSGMDFERSVAAAAGGSFEILVGAEPPTGKAGEF
jgi:hypothetical protein